MSQIKWLPEALDDVQRLHSFLHEKSPEAAARAAKTIVDGANLLKVSPQLGRPMDDQTSRRELFLPFGIGAYVLRYRIEKPDTAVILRVWHSREQREA